MAVGDAFDQFETLLTEFVDDAVVRLVLEDDDPIWAVLDTFKPMSVAGRYTDFAGAGSVSPGYEASWRVQVQEGGRVTAGSWAGNDLEMMGKDSHLAMGQAASAKYPDPVLTPMDSWIKVRLLLKRVIGSVTINHQQIMAELATNPVDRVAGDKLRNAVSKSRSYMTNTFWGDGTGMLAQVNDASPTDPTETAGGVSVTVDAGTFARFSMGDLIQFGSNAEPSVLIQNAGGNAGYARIVNIDRKDRTIKVQSVAGEGTLNISDNSKIFLADTYDFDASTHALAKANIPQGVESLLLDSGTFPGTPGSGYDVDHHSVLKSFITDHSSSNVDPTPEEIALTLDQIADAGLAPPEALFFERSGWTYYAQLERESGAQYVVPQGGAFMASGGVDGPVVQHMGNRFQRFTSVRMRPNSMVGIAPATWRKFMPMGGKGTINWVYSNGPLAGHGSIFNVVHEGRQTTELSEAPFNVAYEVGCDNPMRNFRILGLKTQRDV